MRGYDLGVLVTRVALEGLHTDNIAPSPISHCLLALSVPLEGAPLVICMKTFDQVVGNKLPIKIGKEEKY